MRLALIGVPYSSAGVTNGEALAPAALRNAGLLAALRQAHEIADYGDVDLLPPHPARDPESGIVAPDTLLAMVEAVRREVGRALRDGRLPLVVGGECPLLLGCLAAARDGYGRVGLLFVDGHEDAWAPQQSTTGEAADMELGLALGLTQVSGLEPLATLLPLVTSEETIVLGARDRAELEEAGAPSIASAVTFRDDMALLAGDVGATTAAFAAQLQQTAGRWWFHVDLDVLSSAAMPAVRYPQPGGLAWADLEALCKAALQTPGLIGWDITIYNPDLDPDRHMASRIVAFVAEMVKHWQ